MRVGAWANNVTSSPGSLVAHWVVGPGSTVKATVKGSGNLALRTAAWLGLPTRYSRHIVASMNRLYKGSIMDHTIFHFYNLPLSHSLELSHTFSLSPSLSRA